MNLIEPVILAGAALFGVVGAVWGITSAPIWGLEGFVGTAMRGLGGFVGGFIGGGISFAAVLFALGALLVLRDKARQKRSGGPNPPPVP
ncbi:hypothetical protein FJV41_15910 [Myxococcus llanfairpwllgwyngyllgogerychwyrndrobwllllantysiliogogogochensis]|uniref:Uncharacterized protein n=1 Tax=Myxococcus llanfairpwllgwyngyllgogerychwyrndrobwllllantysiliogogogochensis TaxID=2590453 RepID=A0A540X189_9BACT|nr:hypothetical protein [Myxococcus llanfairpwllgwyngyllgogerychwyrndrobwllllantysiliogogogochensis]TQF14970.1 hypothetical protein FJV41_15910 [Myxococcus llanfairpwllgwyngyllgogerychwyrndrobwllllantysiliogogogochensis]